MKVKIKWLLPIVFVLLLAPFTPKIDMLMAKTFYSFETGRFYNPYLFKFLYKYGEIFGLFVGVLCLSLFLLSWKLQPLKKYRSPCLAFVLTLIIGAGLITNVLFKGYWGRPRPKQLIEFGGNYDYRPYYKPQFFPDESQKSFPSGHAAMGLCYLSFCFSCRHLKKRTPYYLAVVLSIFSGCGLMVARVAQGGHFFSDVTFSFALIWLVALLADKITKSYEYT